MREVGLKNRRKSGASEDGGERKYWEATRRKRVLKRRRMTSLRRGAVEGRAGRGGEGDTKTI